MPRIARIIAEGFPHHIIQRGNRSQKVFFFEKDYQAYLNLLSIYSKLKLHERTGRPLGSPIFIEKLENTLKKPLKKKKPGPKRKSSNN